MSPDPSKSIRSSKSGRVAAAARDGRLAKANESTVMLPVAQHTPGPWSIERGVIASPTRPVAKIQPTRELFHNVLAADAALIAAAPEMLHALELIDSNAAESVEWIRRIARAAINKATGAQS